MNQEKKELPKQQITEEVIGACANAISSLKVILDKCVVHGGIFKTIDEAYVAINHFRNLDVFVALVNNEVVKKKE